LPAAPFILVMINYFDVLGILVSVDVTLDELDSALYNIQSRYHPDKLVKADAPLRAQALEISNNSNIAYNALKKVDSRIEHILALEGFDIKAASKDLPQELLLEAMSWREEEPANILKQYDELLDQIKQSIRKQDYSQGLELYIKLRFLKRFISELNA
jgi:DnaJ-domain-containing protein 1